MPPDLHQSLNKCGCCPPWARVAVLHMDEEHGSRGPSREAFVTFLLRYGYPQDVVPPLAKALLAHFEREGQRAEVLSTNEKFAMM